MTTGGSTPSAVDGFRNQGVDLLAQRGVSARRSDVGRLLDGFMDSLVDDARVRAAAAAIYQDGEADEWLRTVDGSPNTASYSYARAALGALTGDRRA
ncbi:hypothetical protein [Nocardioides pakistanensis]